MARDLGKNNENRQPDDWSRIDSEFQQRARLQRKWDAEHDPSPEFERGARPLGPDYGSERPRFREITPEVAAEFGRTPEELQRLRERDPRGAGRHARLSPDLGSSDRVPEQARHAPEVARPDPFRPDSLRVDEPGRARPAHLGEPARVESRHGHLDAPGRSGSHARLGELPSPTDLGRTEARDLRVGPVEGRHADAWPRPWAPDGWSGREMPWTVRAAGEHAWSTRALGTLEQRGGGLGERLGLDQRPPGLRDSPRHLRDVPRVDEVRPTMRETPAPPTPPAPPETPESRIRRPDESTGPYAVPERYEPTRGYERAEHREPTEPYASRDELSGYAGRSEGGQQPPEPLDVAEPSRAERSYPPSWLTSADRPPPVEQTRTYNQVGHLTEPLPSEQRALEEVVPRDQDGNFERFADPRQDWTAEVNGVGPILEPGRGSNCLDCTLSAISTWHGEPRVSAPRNGEYDSNGEPVRTGERDGPKRAEDWLGQKFEMIGKDASAFDEIERRMLDAGHGTSAVIVNGWAPGGAHAWNAFNYQGKVYWVDTQLGDVSERPLYPQAVDVSAIMIDSEGNKA